MVTDKLVSKFAYRSHGPMSVVIDLADYRDVTPREDEIRLPEDAFVLRALHMIDLGGLVEAHKWFNLAAAKARTESIAQR